MKQQLSLEIGKTGLWTTPEEVSLQLSSISTASGKLAALKSQLKFRRFILQQPAEKSLFQWSSAGKTYRWQEVSQNLLTLIAAMRKVSCQPYDKSYLSCLAKHAAISANEATTKQFRKQNSQFDS